MDIYLDIDGVILTKDGHPSAHLVEFLNQISSKQNVLWLTTHCKGDSAATINYLKRSLPLYILNILKSVKPTNWTTLKTEAIDFSRNFIWIDDYILDAEKRKL